MEDSQTKERNAGAGAEMNFDQAQLFVRKMKGSAAFRSSVAGLSSCSCPSACGNTIETHHEKFSYLAHIYCCHFGIYLGATYCSQICNGY